MPNEYNVSDIKVLSFPDAILKRPEMYVGPGTPLQVFERVLCFMMGYTIGRPTKESHFFGEMELAMKEMFPDIPKNVAPLWCIPDYFRGNELEGLRQVRLKAIQMEAEERATFYVRQPDSGMYVVSRVTPGNSKETYLTFAKTRDEFKTLELARSAKSHIGCYSCKIVKVEMIAGQLHESEVE